jgi:hypothetical protein
MAGIFSLDHPLKLLMEIIFMGTGFLLPPQKGTRDLKQIPCDNKTFKHLVDDMD